MANESLSKLEMVRLALTELGQGTPQEIKASTGSETLEDAFLALTGSTIREEEASGLDQKSGLLAPCQRNESPCERRSKIRLTRGWDIEVLTMKA